MFRIVDRYVLRQFVQLFLICFLSLAGLYIVIDAFGRLDHFVDHSKQTGQLFTVMGGYYAYKSLAFFDKCSGVLALIAAMFTVTWTQRHNEMTALLAAGVPRLRVLRPVIVAAVLVSLAAAATREVVIPHVRQQLAVDTKDLSGESGLDLQSRYDNLTDILIGGEKLSLASQTIERPAFVLPPWLAEQGKHLVAESAQYVPAGDDRTAGYWLRGVRQPAKLTSRPSIRDRENRVVIATPTDHPWLGPDEAFVVSGLPLELLASGSVWRDYASTAELVHELGSPSVELGNDVRVAVHRRLLHPLLDFTLLMLGLPLVVSRGNRNPFVAIGLAVVVVTAFFVVSIGAQSLGGTGWIRPALAAWLPLLVFAPVAVGLSDPLRQ